MSDKSWAALASAATILATVFLGTSALAQRAPEWDYCDANGSGTPDVRIRNCTTLIESSSVDPRNRLVAYNNRGDAYARMGDYDRAIADYSEAIRLDPKYAPAYNNRGNAYKAKGDYDRAITEFIDAIRLDPKYVRAYINRGLAYKAKGDYDAAIADYNEVIRLNPNDATAYDARAYVNAAKGDYDQAIADYNEAIKTGPKYYPAYLGRGVANLYSGALSKAVADFSQASALNPKFAYTALWLDIANRRDNMPSRLDEATKEIDMTKWPAPVIRLYLGQLTPAAVMAAADDPNPEAKMGHVCEANFYSGELALQRGDKNEATRLFRLAAADCRKSFLEYEGAVAELKGLGATQ